MSQYVRDFDVSPTYVVADKSPTVITRKVVRGPTNVQYNWQENYNNMLAVCLGTVQMVLGLILATCGGMAMHYYAYYYSLAGAIWFGILVFFAGLTGTITQCVRKSRAVFTYMVFNLICIAGGLAFGVLLAWGAKNDMDNEEKDAWGCRYDLVDKCDAYERARDAMVIINAIASAMSFLAFLFGILGLITCLYPWVECLRSTDPICSPNDGMCGWCCFTPDEIKKANDQPRQLYSVAGTGPYAEPQPKSAMIRQAIEPAPAVYRQNPAAYASAPVVYSQGPAPLAYTSAPAITYQ